MKNRRGFTLVELLGVIVVLAILALITIPIISNVITNVRIKSLESSAYGLIEASNLYYAQYSNGNSIRFDIDNNKVTSSDTSKLLSYKGSIKEGTVIIDSKGKVTVCVSDGKNSAYKNYNESKVTTIKGVHCSIKENSSIVYLDDEATITEISNIELIERLEKLEEKMSNIYSVGSIYMSMTDDTVEKVEAKFGGTWEALENGRMLQNTTTTSGQTGGNSSYSYTPEGTVGDTTLTDQQMPSHYHEGLYWLNETYGISFNDGSDVAYKVSITGALNNRKGRNNSFRTGISGNSQPHTHTFTGTTENIPTVSPYITVYMYKRVS